MYKTYGSSAVSVSYEADTPINGICCRSNGETVKPEQRRTEQLKKRLERSMQKRKPA